MLKQFSLAIGIGAILSAALPAASPAASPISQLKATGHDSRVDLVWTGEGSGERGRFNVYRADSKAGPYERLNRRPHLTNVYSDFIGGNGRTYFYRVTREQKGNIESARSEVVSASTRAMNDEQLLSSIQAATFRYFWEFGHPVSGLSREGFLHPRATVTTGGSGFGMMAIVVGVERGFVTREQGAARLLKMVRFLQDDCTRYHGMWAHWLDGATGKTISFAGRKDNGGDIAESSFLMQGMLAVRQYFDRDNAVESELRGRITKLWRDMEWDWYLREPAGRTLYWHWSPDHGWAMNHQIHGFNECMVTYLLAMASPTHPIPDECYEQGWIHDRAKYAAGGEFFGIKQIVGRGKGGPLFFTHYSFLGIDPRQVTDPFGNYFEINRNTTLINRAYCIDNPKGFQGYGPNLWGLTSSQGPQGYKGHSPGRDEGTIAPTAAISAMPYTPKYSLAAMKHMYHELGDKIWGPFGFYDAFNLEKDWVSKSFLAIDQGPIVVMVENHRTGLLWRLFMANPQMTEMLGRLPK